MSNNAPVKWAQRSDLIFLTICLLDVEVIEIKLHPNRLIFTGKSDAKLYSVDLELVRSYHIIYIYLSAYLPTNLTYIL
jgi:hypothetical protein